jgi:uncharacterized membrane protein YeiB
VRVHPVAEGRIVGIDVARGAAILGMFIAHAVPRPDDTELLVDGRSSILFATLAGVSLGIVTGGDRPAGRGQRTDRVVSILLRAACLFLLGGILGALESEVAVILDYYGFMFVLLVPVLFFPRWVLAVMAAALAGVAPALAAAAPDTNAVNEPVLYFFQYYLLDGVYPALVWMPFLVAGLICARSGLDRQVTQLAMIAGGALAAVVGYGAALVLAGVTAEAHSSTTAEVVGSGGVALAVIGTLLWLTSAERAGAGQWMRGALWPIGATGSMALTVYTLQILTLAVVVVMRDDSGAIEYPGWPLLIGMTIASLLFASLWQMLFGKGPLERLLAYVARSPRQGTSDARNAPDSRAQLPR